VRALSKTNLIIGAGIIAGLGLVSVFLSTTGAADATAQEGVKPTGTALPKVPTVPDSDFLQVPLAAADQKYAAIQGKRLVNDVKELTAISRKYRDAGHQFWGRIMGTDADQWNAEWLAAKLKAAGAVNVRIQPIDIQPQWMPQSWELVASSSGKTARLDSAQPARGSIGIPSTELDVVYVGLATEADFAGRDVRGKGALIYGIPISGARTTSASLNGAFKRAADRGAAAILLVVGLPGNISSMVSVGSRSEDEAPTNLQIPAFTLGSADGDAVRRLIETAPAGRPPTLKVRLDVKSVPGLKSSNVWGEIPGTSDEDILLVAHRDGYFEGASDNASGVASGVALAEYFAKMPQAERRRTIRIVGSPGHHGGGGSPGVRWMADNKATVLAKTAYLINLEHTGHARVERSGNSLYTVNVQGTFGWGATGSPAAIGIATRAYDLFLVPRRPGVNSGGPGAESNLIAPFVAASTGVIHAAPFYHTDAEAADTVPASGIEAVTRAYAKIIDDVNRLSIAELRGPVRSKP